MKKIICMLMAAVLTLMSVAAMADTVIDPLEKRNIKLQPVSDNEVETGISPTTGLTLNELDVPSGFTGMAKTGRYVPMMAQIGNDEGGIGYRAPWGAYYADIVYETMIHKNGQTRLTFLFNDVIPDSVGPIRSVRLAHVWLREEWGAGYLYHGRQEYSATNVVAELSKLGHPWVTDPMIFDNNSGEKAWNRFFNRREPLISPNNVNVIASGAYTLVPENQEFNNHTFKFTDETPEGDPAMSVRVAWIDTSNIGQGEHYCGSVLKYDVDANAYLRYMVYGKNDLRPWVDYDAGAQIAFANVIVQFTPTSFKGNDAPIQNVINTKTFDKGSKTYTTAAQGNADFFMAGKHIAGSWRRENSSARTVYYDADGNEISLQRGKTLIIIFPDNHDFGSSITYSDQLNQW